MNEMKMLNLGLAFILELCMFASFGFWASSLEASVIFKMSVGVIATIIAIVLWAVFCAPNSETRLAQPKRYIFQLVIFTAAALLLYNAGRTLTAAALVGAWVISSTASLVWKQ